MLSPQVGNEKLMGDEEGADWLGGTEHGAGGSDEHCRVRAAPALVALTHSPRRCASFLHSTVKLTFTDI